jgi:hypothetical protein
MTSLRWPTPFHPLRIAGDSGNDTIQGGSDNNVIYGGSGNDILIAALIQLLAARTAMTG